MNSLMKIANFHVAYELNFRPNNGNNQWNNMNDWVNIMQNTRSSIWTQSHSNVFRVGLTGICHNFSVYTAASMIGIASTQKTSRFPPFSPKDTTTKVSWCSKHGNHITTQCYAFRIQLLWAEWSLLVNSTNIWVRSSDVVHTWFLFTLL